MAIYRTPKQRLIANLLAGSTGARLEDWLAEQREAGMSYELMSHALSRSTGEYISVRTLRSWIDELVDAA